jgi:4-amino-4-deoxy-L-arabinose transferase-like glycosyltransferase
MNKERLLIIFILFLLLFAVYFNLGELPFRSDDGLRGLVAFEMEQTGEYIVPHLWGEIYLKKPPLFNWMIVASTKALGSWSNFAIRFATASSLIFFGLSIYLFLKKHYQNWKIPFVSAIASVTTSTILYADAMVAEIDVSFSVLIYCVFMSVINWFDSKPLKMYLMVYLFAAGAFLMKGFPVVLFVGFTLFAWAIYKKKWKTLWHWSHFAGIGLFILLVGGYYFTYLVRYSDNLSLQSFYALMQTLWEESTMRTVDENFGAKIYILNFFRFPLRMISSLLPWSLLMILLFRKGTKKTFLQNDLLTFSVLTILVNIWIYWVSPGNNLRYTLMFIPLFITPLVHLYYTLDKDVKAKKTLNAIIRFASVLVPAGIVWSFSQISEVEHGYLLASLFLGGSLIIVWWVWKREQQLLLYFIILVIWVKCTYNVLGLPIYADSLKERRFELLALETAQKSKGHKLYVYDRCSINADITLYLARERNEVIKRTKEIIDPEAYYIFDQADFEKFDGERKVEKIISEFETRQVGRKLYMVALK